MPNQVRRFTPEFKLEVVQRLLRGESLAAVAREIRIKRDRLYEWKLRYEQGGPDNLRIAGRPKKNQPLTIPGRGEQDLQEKIRLERIIGQQQAMIDFLQDALQRIERKNAPAGKAKSMQQSVPHSDKEA